MPDEKFWVEWLKENNKEERIKKIKTLWFFNNTSFGIVTPGQLNDYFEGLVKLLCEKVAVKE